MLGKVEFATQLRDVVTSIARAQIRKLHPPAVYGVVQSFDRRALTAQVLLPGDTEPVTVRMGGIQPQQNGQKVRICPLRGDLFLEDVVGPVFVVGVAGVSNTAKALVNPPSPGGGSPGGLVQDTDTQCVAVQLAAPTAAPTVGIVHYIAVPATAVGRSVAGLSASVVTIGAGATAVQLVKVNTAGTFDVMSDMAIVDAFTRTSLESVIPATVDGDNATLAVGDLLRLEVRAVGSVLGLNASVSFA